MAAVSTQLNNFILPAYAPAREDGKSWLARLGTLVAEIRTRQADREIARFIESRGGRMTDDLERQIARMSL